MTEPLGASAFASLGAVPVSNQTAAPLGASAFASLGAVPINNVPRVTQTDSTLNNVVNSPGVQGILGAGDAIRNTIASAANLIPGVNIAPVQTGNGGISYNIGNIAGNVGSFIGGGEALDTARSLSEGLPLIGSLAQKLGGSGAAGIARRALGSAAYGAASTNQDRLSNAKTGAEWSAALDAVPGLAGKIVEGAQYFQPQKYSQKILNDLSGGQNMSEATKSVLSAVKNSYQNQLENARELYNPVFSAVPSGSIYAPLSKDIGSPQKSLTNNVYDNYQESVSPGSVNDFGAPANRDLGEVSGAPTGQISIIPSTMAANTEKVAGGQATAAQNFKNLTGLYPNLPSSVTDNYTNAIQKLHDKFVNDPTFQNAHNLQSQIGSRLREIESTPFPTPATRNEIDALSEARSALIDRDANGNVTGDMGNYLNNLSPSLADQYKNATDNFLENVVPYRNNKKISPIATGKITNVQPSTLSNIFKSPDEDAEKVISDLPVGTMDKVLYTKLGQQTPAINPITLLRQSGRLNEQGLGDYISPQLKGQLDSLQNRINWRTRLQSAVGAMAAAAGGASHGTAGAIGTGLAGASLASPLMNYLGRRLNLDGVSQAIGNLLSKSYPVGRSAAIANRLNYSGVQNNGS